MTALEKRISSLAFNPPPRTTISSSNSRDRDSDRLSPGGSVSVEEKKKYVRIFTAIHETFLFHFWPIQCLLISFQIRMI